ncbi:hypothetical protein C2845_PM16G17980 [Panicum miliaceum]|uniref:Uncharacterized protein n=1 Tax=Panicum miliaceum TaxID=4540 RepID=A0A3L6PX08_PANMI|nr:hypothetical protein C2845_PM16G17980 [Panicum miliaceum]
MASSAACAGFFFDAEPLGATTLPALDVRALCARPLGRDNDIFILRRVSVVRLKEDLEPGGP